jgi:NDP-sugar pyrophosphorylase family protein
MEAVILAGGRGTRLAPYTTILPKPLMPIGDKAVLEILVEQLRAVGISDFVFCVGHLAHLIQTLFDNHARSGVNIRYLYEDAPLGTAGPLHRLERPADTFLVMNGDVLTTLDFRELVRHHREGGNILTVACKDRSLQIDYGILHLSTNGNGRGHGPVIAWEEKPSIELNVSMGIYVLERQALEYVPDGYFDFPDLVGRLLDRGLPVGAYVYDGLWFDIGRREDYEEAVAAWGLPQEWSTRTASPPPAEAPQLAKQLFDRAAWRKKLADVRGPRPDGR